MSLFVLAEAIAAYNGTLQNLPESRIEKYNWDSAAGKRRYIDHCKDYIKLHCKEDVSKVEIANAIRDTPALEAVMPRSLYPDEPFNESLSTIDLELGESSRIDQVIAPDETSSVTVSCLEKLQQTADSSLNPRDELQSEVALAIYDEALRVKELVRNELTAQIDNGHYMKYSCAERNSFYAVLPSVSYQTVAEECIANEICLDYPYSRSVADPSVPYFTQYVPYTPSDEHIQMASFYFRFIRDPRTATETA